MKKVVTWIVYAGAYVVFAALSLVVSMLASQSSGSSRVAFQYFAPDKASADVTGCAATGGTGCAGCGGSAGGSDGCGGGGGDSGGGDSGGGDSGP